MIEQTIWCFMTSKDAEEIAQKLKELEENPQWGKDLAVKLWYLEPSGNIHTYIKFILDQERAEKLGLIKQ